MGLLPEALVAVAALVGLTWPARERRLLMVTTIAFAVRFAIGMVLYLISLYHLGLFQQLQLPGGFWSFSIDASTYNTQAVQVSRFLAGDAPFPDGLDPIVWFFGFAYRMFGATPPTALLANAAIAAACVPLMFYAGRSFRLSRGWAMLGAAVVAAWPSSFAWSGQVMKDPLSWFAALCIVAGGGLFLESRLHAQVAAAAIALLVTGEVIVSRLRSYIAPSWLLALVVACACYLLLNRKTPRSAVRRVAALLLVLMLANIPSYGAYVDILQSAQITVGAAGSVPDLQRAPSASEPKGPGAAVHECMPAYPLLSERNGFLQIGGGALVGGKLVTCADVLRFVPNALELMFLAPTPDSWLRSGATTGVGRQLAGLDAVLMWLLLPGLLLASLQTIVRPAPLRLALLVYVGLVGLSMGVAVANFGTLYRLRLQVLLPAVLLAMEGWSSLRAIALARHMGAVEARLEPSA